MDFHLLKNGGVECSQCLKTNDAKWFLQCDGGQEDDNIVRFLSSLAVDLKTGKDRSVILDKAACIMTAYVSGILKGKTLKCAHGENHADFNSGWGAATQPVGTCSNCHNAPEMCNCLDKPGPVPERVVEPNPLPVAATLNLLPEVTWDRFSGDDGNIGVFGWIYRQDGRADYVMVMIDNGGPWLFSTSSAKYSATFAARLGMDGDGHTHCRRIEDHFPEVRCIRLNACRHCDGKGTVRIARGGKDIQCIVCSGTGKEEIIRESSPRESGNRNIHSYLIENGEVTDRLVVTIYNRCTGIMNGDGYVRVFQDCEGYDAETRIDNETLIAAGWTPPSGDFQNAIGQTPGTRRNTMNDQDSSRAAGSSAPACSAPYGFCPICGAYGVTRERRPDGNDRCSAGHTYPSRNSVGEDRPSNPLP